MSFISGEQRVVVKGNELFDAVAATFTPITPKETPFPPALRTEIVRWDATDRAITVAARSENAVLAIKENRNDGWEAKLDGVVLDPITLDGWQQGWVLPQGAKGTVELTFKPDQQYRGALGVGFAGLAFVAVLAVLPARRRERPLRPGSGRLLLGLLGAALLALFGGVWAVALMVGLTCLDAAVYWFCRTRTTRLVRWIAPAGLYALAGALLAARPWPSPDYLGGTTVTQALVLGVLVSLWLACGAGEWLAWTTAGLVLRQDESSPPPPESSPPSSERTTQASSP
jgi:arabinofuranan 3-O-arabinosyltransferase